jgi:hypothetical protein
VSRFLTGVGARVAGRVSSRMVRVNGGWSGLVYIDGVLDAVYCIRAQGDRIGASRLDFDNL